MTGHQFQVIAPSLRLPVFGAIVTAAKRQPAQTDDRQERTRGPLRRKAAEHLNIAKDQEPSSSFAA